MKKIIKNLLLLLSREIPTNTLIKRGMKVGNNFNRQQGCYLDPTHCWLISIGNNVTFSIRVTVLAHDASCKNLIGYTKIGKVSIGNNVFIGANSTILPGISVGSNCIVGANSIVTRDIPDNTVVAGNPARMICSVDDYKIKCLKLIDTAPIFDESYTMRVKLTVENKNKMIEVLNNTKIGLIE